MIAESAVVTLVDLPQGCGDGLLLKVVAAQDRACDVKAAGRHTLRRWRGTGGPGRVLKKWGLTPGVRRSEFLRLSETQRREEFMLPP